MNSENETIYYTRKIQLLINSEDIEFIKETRMKLYSWQRICVRAANQIISHLYIQDQVKDFLYFTENVRGKLADHKIEETGIFISSQQSTTYRLLSKSYKAFIPMSILTALNDAVLKTYRANKLKYYSGESALPNFRKTFAMPFGARNIRHLARTEDGKNFSFDFFQIPFRTYIGKDTQRKKDTLEKVMRGDVKLKQSYLKVEDNKFFLIATFEAEKLSVKLDQMTIAEASLSIETPITAKVGRTHIIIGSKEEFLHRRLAIQAAMIRVQKGSTYNSGGKGIKKKLKPLEHYTGLEKRYVTQKIHVYSRQLINFCLKNGAGTLILVNQEAREEIAKEDAFLLRNWGYYDLKEKISYKANIAGINVIIE